jgi:D-tyrosyl-tRNA(Tyr) deacylase
LRAVVQRVARAEVRVDGAVTGSIGKGLLVYAGVEKDDTTTDIEYIASKITGLRVFEDTEGRMNLDVKETGSRRDTGKGERPV